MAESKELISTKDIKEFWEEMRHEGFYFNIPDEKQFPFWYDCLTEDPTASDEWLHQLFKGLILCKRYGILCYCQYKETCEFCTYILQYMTIPQISSACSLHHTNCDNNLCMGKIVSRHPLETL